MLSVMPELMPSAAKPPEGGKDTETLSDDDARAAASLGISTKDFAEFKKSQAKR
jgi:phage I-like protein